MKHLMALLFISNLSYSAEFIRTINVEGFAEKAVKPNIAYLNLTIWAKGDNAKKALSLQVKNSEALKKVIKDSNIDSKDITSSGFSVDPIYVWDQKLNQNNLNGYNASESLNISISKIEDLGKVIDSVVKGDKDSGVSVNSIQWDITNRESITDEILDVAVKNAERKAQILAKTSNVKIKRVYAINPVSSNDVARPMMNLKMSMSERSSDRVPDLQAGQIKVSTNVNIIYELE